MKVIAVIAVLVLIVWVDCLAQKGNGVKKLNPNLLDTPKKIAIHISIGGIKQPNPIIIGLFTKETPKTTENFLKICEGKFRSNYTGQQMHYSATNFHRIIPKFMM
jgi:peptidylprolyl isomerase